MTRYRLLAVAAVAAVAVLGVASVGWVVWSAPGGATPLVLVVVAAFLLALVAVAVRGAGRVATPYW